MCGWHQDSKGRILSGTIKLGSLKSHELFEIIVYDESFVQSKVLEPPTLKMMHDKWAMFTVYQMEQYLNSATNSDPPVSFESRELFGLLDELKHSKSEGVQGSVVKCLELMLNNSRNVVLIKYIADELQALFELTNHEAIAISVLKHIQKLYKISKSCVKVDELMENVYTKIKSLGCNNEEFLKYCDYDIDNKKQDEKLQVKGCNSSEENERRYNLSSEMEEASNMQTAVEYIDTFSSPSGRMGLSRVIELLHSDDMNCRNFALDKLIRSTSSYGLDRNGRDDIISEIRGPDEPPELLRALFACLKKSLKPPSEILAKAGTKVRQPLSFLIADKALHSPNSNFKDIFSCIKCIHWIVKKWSYDSCYDVLSMKWRILLTLTHASDRQDEDLEIAERCGELLILLTNRDGWIKYNIALERDSITYFLGSEHPLMRTILALSYVKCNFNFENEYDRSSSANDEGSVIICSNDFANLRSIWRWCVGNYSQNVCIPALEVLSSALVLSEVKSHMIKYDPLDKVSSCLIINLQNLMFFCNSETVVAIIGKLC